MAQKRSTAGKSRSGARATGKSRTARSGSAKSATAKSGAKSTGAKSATAKKTAKSTAAKSTAKSKSGSSRSAASRKAAASKGGKATARKRTARKAAGTTAATAARGARSAGIEAKTVAELRDALRKNLIRPMDMVMISRERIEEVLGEAVDQGRVTARDAQRITSGLVKRGQRQTSDVLKDLENLLGRGRDEIGGARTRAVRTASPALAQVDRVRRGAGVGASFPITGYDDLTAPQITGRLGSLRPAELRKVRDYERRNASRKTVLGAIESMLS